MAKLIDIASTELGVSEVEGSIHNERILGYAKESGFDWVESDEVPWCSIFLNWVAKKGGMERSKDARAQSWDKVGVAVKSPVPGDIVLLAEGSTIYHVGIFTGFGKDGNTVFCLGGNQRNQVSIAPFPAKHIRSFRRLSVIDNQEYSQYVAESQPKVASAKPVQVEPKKDTPKPTPLQPLFIPDVKLSHGDTGNYVEMLQKALHAIGAYTAKIDGRFGADLAVSVTAFRKRNGMSGKSVYNGKVRKLLIAELTRKGIAISG